MTGDITSDDDSHFTPLPNWWVRGPVEPREITSEDVERDDFPQFNGTMRLRIEPIDPSGVTTNFEPDEHLLVEFNQIDEEVWDMAYQLFCLNGGFVPNNDDNLSSIFTQQEQTENARAIFDQFHPEGTLIYIDNYYEICVERSTVVDFVFWTPRNPQSKRRMRNAWIRWRSLSTLII